MEKTYALVNTASGEVIRYVKTRAAAERDRKKAIEYHMQRRVLRQILRPNTEERKRPLFAWISLEYIHLEDLFALGDAKVHLGGMQLTGKRASYLLTLVRSGSRAIFKTLWKKDLSDDEMRLAERLMEEEVEDLEVPAGTLSRAEFAKFRAPIILMGRDYNAPGVTLGRDPEESDDDDGEYCAGDSQDDDEEDDDEEEEKEDEEDPLDDIGQELHSGEEEDDGGVAKQESDMEEKERKAALERDSKKREHIHETEWSEVARHLARASLLKSQHDERLAIELLLKSEEFVLANGLSIEIEEHIVYD